MNARVTPFGQLLAPSFDFHGLKLDLYGTLDEEGYRVHHVCVPGSLIAITECVSEELIAALGAALDDLLPTSEQLVKASHDESRLERALHDQNMGIFGYSGMG